MEQELSLLTVFAAGLLSFLSPLRYDNLDQAVNLLEDAFGAGKLPPTGLNTICG